MVASAREKLRPRYVRVALPVPVFDCFDYLLPPGMHPPPTGSRVRVNLGKREAVGITLGWSHSTKLPSERIKPLLEILDPQPVFDSLSFKMIGWAADYYLEPIGMALSTALPSRLRQMRSAQPPVRWRYGVTEAGRDASSKLSRAPRQQAVLERLCQSAEQLAAEALCDIPGYGDALKSLIQKSLVSRTPAPCLDASHPARDCRPELNSEQQEAVSRVAEALGRYQAFVLAGVTGSGKTEVYLSVVEQALARGAQALVLAPEIALTPQFVARFRSRFRVPIAVLHSGLPDTERHCAWWAASREEAAIVIGTRSAVFTPMPKLGVVIVDEEHDLSYKQQDGFRYHARDLAVYRAALHHAPIVLGSATPSLESLHNVDRGKYRLLRLTERAGAAKTPAIEVVDLRNAPTPDGLSEPLVAAMTQELETGGQVLLFLNRRGFAPVLICCKCGWTATCAHCDARMTLHRTDLRCHHCDARAGLPEQCPECGNMDLKPVGAGTQRVERTLAGLFPQFTLARIDRDTMRSRAQLELTHRRIVSGEVRILVGTQMLSKGHDFPGVGLVGMLNTDQALYHTDFRAAERFAQLLVQVAGRAGRGERPGRVLIQTQVPNHPLLQQLLSQGYFPLVDELLAGRRAVGLPPTTHLALLRAEAVRPDSALDVLARAGRALKETAGLEVQVLGPAPAPMERRQGRYRAQLLLRATARVPLKRSLKHLVEFLNGYPEVRRVRWSLDVDPMELY